MSIERLHITKRFSEVAIHNGTVYLAGQLADDFSGDITQQTRETLASIDGFLADAGTDKSRILSVMIYLKDIEADYAAFNAVTTLGSPTSLRCRAPASKPRCTSPACWLKWLW